MENTMADSTEIEMALMLLWSIKRELETGTSENRYPFEVAKRHSVAAAWTLPPAFLFIY